MSYDSRLETYPHIMRVQALMLEFCKELMRRAVVHDASKLTTPEKEAFDEVTEKLRGLTYGSDEYKAQLDALKPALLHHYDCNSHHPEYWTDGISGMSLFDIVEMFCDWKAATERHNDGSIDRSIEINKKRFNISDQLTEILKNTTSWVYNK